MKFSDKNNYSVLFFMSFVLLLGIVSRNINFHHSSTFRTPASNDIDLGSGSRIDSDGDDAAENDDGTRKAEASLEDFVTLYANYPFGGGNAYALLGVHMATVATTETLPNSSYDDEDIYGLQVGVGTRNGNYKVEFSYSDFEDVNISSTGGNTNKVDADIDMLQFRVAYSF